MILFPTYHVTMVSYLLHIIVPSFAKTLLYPTMVYGNKQKWRQNRYNISDGSPWYHPLLTKRVDLPIAMSSPPRHLHRALRCHRQDVANHLKRSSSRWNFLTMTMEMAPSLFRPFQLVMGQLMIITDRVTMEGRPYNRLPKVTRKVEPLSVGLSGIHSAANPRHFYLDSCSLYF